MVVPAALKVVWSTPTRKFACQGRLAREMSWSTRQRGTLWRRSKRRLELLSEEAVHGARETGRKDHEGKTQQLHRGPQDQWARGVSPVKTASKKIKMNIPSIYTNKIKQVKSFALLRSCSRKAFTTCGTLTGILVFNFPAPWMIRAISLPWWGHQVLPGTSAQEIPALSEAMVACLGVWLFFLVD